MLKNGGHFSISDIVLVGDLPAALKQDAEMYAGCIAGAIPKSEYLQLIEKNGFENITLQKEKPIVIPDDILSKYLSAEEVKTFNKSGTGIFSITVYAEKSGSKPEKPDFNLNELELDNSCCTPQNGCC